MMIPSQWHSLEMILYLASFHNLNMFSLLQQAVAIQILHFHVSISPIPD